MKFLVRYILGTAVLGAIFSFGAIGLSGISVIGAPAGLHPPLDFLDRAIDAALTCYAFVAICLAPVVIVAYLKQTE